MSDLRQAIEAKMQEFKATFSNGVARLRVYNLESVTIYAVSFHAERTTKPQKEVSFYLQDTYSCVILVSDAESYQRMVAEIDAVKKRLGVLKK